MSGITYQSSFIRINLNEKEVRLQMNCDAFIPHSALQILHRFLELNLGSDLRDYVEANRDKKNKSLDRLLPVNADAHD